MPYIPPILLAIITFICLLIVIIFIRVRIRKRSSNTFGWFLYILIISISCYLQFSNSKYAMDNISVQAYESTYRNIINTEYGGIEPDDDSEKKKIRKRSYKNAENHNYQSEIFEKYLLITGAAVLASLLFLFGAKPRRE